jgi:hypothetical protein
MSFTYFAESSFKHEDKDKEYPETYVVVQSHEDEGTETIATFDITAKSNVDELLECVNGNASNNAKMVEAQIKAQHPMYCNHSDLMEHLTNNLVDNNAPSIHKHSGYEKEDCLCVIYYDDGSMLVITPSTIVAS